MSAVEYLVREDGNKRSIRLDKNLMAGVGVLLAQDVAAHGVPRAKLPARAQLEALLRTGVRLDLGHGATIEAEPWSPIFVELLTRIGDPCR